MTKETLIEHLAARKAKLVNEVAAIDLLLDIHQGEGEPAKRAPKPKGYMDKLPANGSNKGYRALPDGDKSRIVLQIARDLYAKHKRPITVEEIHHVINAKGYRVPRDKNGYTIVTAYLAVGGEFKRRGDGYLPASVSVPLGLAAQ